MPPLSRHSLPRSRELQPKAYVQLSKPFCYALPSKQRCEAYLNITINVKLSDITLFYSKFDHVQNVN